MTNEDKNQILKLASKYYKAKDPITKKIILLLLKNCKGVASVTFTRKNGPDWKIRGILCETTDHHLYKFFNLNNFIDKKLFIDKDLKFLKRTVPELEAHDKFYACIASVKNDNKTVVQWLEDSCKAYDLELNLAMEKTDYYSIRNLSEISRTKISNEKPEIYDYEKYSTKKQKTQEDEEIQKIIDYIL